MLTLKHLFGILWLTVHLFDSIYCSGGESTQFRKQDDHGNYKFGYDINDGYGGNHFHKETGDEHGNKRGSYGILGADGKMRIVHYIADEHGFRVDIKSNEPGIAQGKDSAAAIVNGKDPDEHHPDYSSSYGQRTAGYHAPSPLYLSSTSHHPASKPYYLSSLSKPDHSDVYSSPPNEAYVPVKPHKSYSNYALAAKSYYPKNVAYKPKYHYPYYPKPKSYEAPTYSPSYSSPSYGTSSYDSSSPNYEPTHYPSPVHKPTYSIPSTAHDYNSYESPVYGTRKTAYASDLYGKSAEPVHSYTKLSGYSTKKHNEKIKYYNHPYDHPSASGSGLLDTSSTSTASDTAPLTTAIDTNTIEKKKEDEEVAEAYRTEPKSGVISTKPKPIGLIGLTSYRNPYSIDSEYKSS